MSPPKKPSYHVHDNGFIMPPASSFPVHHFLSALAYVPDSDDVFICTYPKCGTTWSQNILHLLRTKGTPLGRDQHICEVAPHLEESGADFVRSLERPRLIKTHLPSDLVPRSPSAKYIYIARNPKDCCVSFYHHTVGFPGYQFQDGTFDDFFDLFLSGEVDFGDYFDNLLSWYRLRHLDHVLFLLYEDMKKDTEACVRQMGEFLGGAFRQACNDAAVLEVVLRNSSFEAMKGNPQNWCRQRVEGTAAFIRRGQVGDWRKYFSEEQTRLLDEKFRAKLSGTEAEHLWDAYDC